MSASTVTVLLFSVLRERAGTASLQRPLPDPPTGTALLDALVRDVPALAGHRPVIRLAVGDRFVPEDTELREGDEVALITPVSGG